VDQNKILQQVFPEAKIKFNNLTIEDVKACNRKGIFTIFGEPSWNGYRECHEDMRFDFRVLLNHILDKMYPNQNSSHKKQFAKMFSRIKRSNLKVVELGCHQGLLAKDMLRRFDFIESWTGYDFPSPIERTVVEDKRYKPIILEKHFFKTDLPEFDVFVSSHTFEHLSYKEVKRTLRNVLGVEYILLETPLTKGGQKWIGYGGAHVLRWGSNLLKDYIESLGYKNYYSGMRNWVLGFRRIK